MHDLTSTYGPIEERVHLDEERSILFMSDGAIRFRHVCRALNREMVIAPALQIGNGHTVVTRDPLTIVASILCDAERGCTEHGFVTNGRWIAV